MLSITAFSILLWIYYLWFSEIPNVFTYAVFLNDYGQSEVESEWDLVNEPTHVERLFNKDDLVKLHKKQP